MNYHLTRVSRNGKTGPMAVTTHDSGTCPDSCLLKNNGCYASAGRLAIHWREVNAGRRGTDFKGFLNELKALPRGSKLRLAQAGDLSGKGNRIDAKKLESIASAVRRLEVIAYTHKPLTPHNLKAINSAYDKGLVINISADNAIQAARLKKEHQELAVVTVLPLDAPNDQEVEGIRVVACPAEKSDKIQCINCMLCAKKREYVIGFRAHGSQKKKANLIASFK